MVKIKTLNSKGAVDNGTGHVALDLCLGRPAWRTGFMRSLHCFRDRVVAINGYSKVFMMVLFRQYQPSCLETCLVRMASAHLLALESRN